MVVYAITEVKRFCPGVKIKNITHKYAQQYFTDSEEKSYQTKRAPVLSMVVQIRSRFELITATLSNVSGCQKSRHIRNYGA